MKNYKIINDRAPKRWIESLPVGNGRMGATLMGAVAAENVYFNEESIWGSKPNPGANPEMPAKLKQIRDLFLEGKIIEANELGERILGDCYTRIESFEYGGKMTVELHESDACRDYKTEIDLMNGVASVEYAIRDSRYRRECFVSYPDDVIACRITSSCEPLCAYVSYARENIDTLRAEGCEIRATGHTVVGGHRFAVAIKVVTDGKVSASDGVIKVTDTDSIVIFARLDTDFKSGDSFEQITFPTASYESIKARHIADFSAIMSRADVDIHADPTSEPLPMSQRRDRLLWSEADDESFYTLLWQLGRYLLASSSRPGSLPANLQGVWSDQLAAAWGGDYHTNINIQENYWPAEVANLSECHLPLFDYMNNCLLESGKETARVGYGARGCAVHHLSDIYGFTAPADGLHGIWPHGASWLCYHMWDHYTFTQDVEFLRSQAYEFIRQSAIFFLDVMVEDKNGYLVFGPSHSPENCYLVTDEQGVKHKCTLTVSAAMDTEIISGLLEIYIKSSELLGITDSDVDYARAALTKMPPLVIGKYGQLSDWMEDYEEFEVGHHHLSPAFGLYPGYTIDRSTPELLKAIGVTLHRRLTGLNSAGKRSNITAAAMGITWLGCMYARLLRGNDAYAAVQSFAKHNTLSNMLNFYPHGFGTVYQCDGNLAYVANVCEMLIQSHSGVISLIPAIPDKWASGSFKGLRARGGFEIDAEWDKHSIVKINVRSVTDGECRIELPATQTAHSFTDGISTYLAADGIITVKPGRSITLKSL